MKAFFEKNWHQIFSLAAVIIGAIQADIGLFQPIVSPKLFPLLVMAMGVLGSVLGAVDSWLTRNAADQ